MRRGGRTTTSPLFVSSPARTRASELSVLPFPSVALWMSVAKKQKDASTRGSKAACEPEKREVRKACESGGCGPRGDVSEDAP